VLAGSRQLRTSRGNVPYRELVLAHGAQARTLTQCPPSLCWRINHLQAYAAFRAALGTAPQHLAVIGAGLIGSELANDLALAGHGVTLLDQADRPLAAVLSPAQSQQLLSAWAALPLHFVGGVQVSALRALPAKVSVDAADAAPRRAAQRELRTTDGQVFCVDQVVLAAGLETPGRLAHSAGLAWHNGIAVQPLTLATGVAGVHALGDCIAIAGQVSRYIEPIGRQAQTIAARLLGAPAQPYLASRVPLRVKTSSLPFTL
jgi:rubredoxin-NAD+ reductase